MDKKVKQEQKETFDHYIDNQKPKETASAEELAKYYSSNATIPIDVSKFDK
ncbi:hypothetical protein [Aquibacillus kalidii]|uniref:hypothetical protein n=1 Tax=Aquibacillus kalidii TaxID=2762597 RepID=UPI0016481C17|nr:hypothetical protein [Aquibacillus kalidii]